MNTTVNFRLLALDMMQAYTLKREIPGASFYKDDASERFVGLIPLREDLFDQLNDYFIRQQIRYEDCDILVQADTTRSEQEVSVPNVVNKMLKYVDCKLTYSVRLVD
ncbi:hypothetical protein D210916BOD24_12190 [Alteromonas sp. D210916BOD_24]|uniref:hypothetical protein n=1 Tax=Alteromonas sp. D210916BOD_24 TaxID=3157618 RepID=UPI00399CF34A